MTPSPAPRSRSRKLPLRGGLGWLCILPALVSLTPTPSAAASVTFTSAMQAASQARQVPLALIEATAYVNSRWQWISVPSMDGGVGPMHITPSQVAQAGALSGHSRAEIAGDLSANLDAGAALLAKAHTGGTDLASWRPAVVATQGPHVATQIYDALRSGVSGTASSGEQITLAPRTIASSSPPRAPSAPAVVPDYSGATWIPADPANYTYANRPHDYPIDMIVIHDIEGTYGSAIQAFQDPTRAGSAHYVVSDAGEIAQMVLEKDIAWHAGNWDYNTRAIGIEHEGYAYAQPTWYTPTMYEQSAYLIATICSRRGVPMDRQHVIGHSEVPDPNDPTLFGGADHHTDPGPYWDWPYYMSRAVHYASGLPSPPHMMPDPVATNGLTSATVTWQAARTCHTPISGYTVTGQPGNLNMNLGGSARSATFNNLQSGTTYTFTVTAVNAEGQDIVSANTVTPGHCNLVRLSASPTSPQQTGTAVQLSGTSAGCPDPLYAFGVLAPGSSTWTLAQPYSSSSTFSWNTTGQSVGAFQVAVNARDSASPGPNSNALGPYDGNDHMFYTLTVRPCAAVTATATPATVAQGSGAHVTLGASASVCPNPRYEFWLRAGTSGTWQVVQGYGTGASYDWNSTGADIGTVYLGVHARDAASTASYDAAASAKVSVTTPTCASVTVLAAPATVSSGTHVTVTAAATGCTSTPRYEFWLRPATSSTWLMVQGYGPSATYDWNSTGADPGTVYFGVRARDTGSAADYDAVASTPVTVTTTSCALATASAAPTTVVHSSGGGAHVTVTAAAAGCTTSPRYEFWIRAASSSTWLLVQGYGPSATYDWNSTGAAPGTVYFGVWVRDANSAAGYDRVASTSVNVT